VKEDAALRRLRRLCGRLQDATETTTFGHPTFQRKGKTFAVLDSYGGEGCVCFKAIPPVQRSLIRSRAFFPAPYGARHGWTCIRLSSKVDWRRLALLVNMSYDLMVKAKARKSPHRSKAGKGSRAANISRSGA
jgi:predicted DNA-binding protein (MmcQ/YjbR family)